MPKSENTLHNPLDRFASYSIHHILLACRTTQDARVFMDEDRNGQTLAAIDQVRELGDAVPIDDANTAFLVIDTRRFSQFSVEKMQYEVLVNGVEKKGSHGNLATKVDMTISDAVGISFINFIQWLMEEKMQTNFDGMIFMHRVVFVGHTPDGQTEIVQSVTIPMHLFKLELSLDTQRGTYTAEFMPNMNFDTVQHDRWLTIYNANNYFTGRKSTNMLGDIIQSFENALNDASHLYFRKAQERLSENPANQGKGDMGREVRYQITIPKEWMELRFTGAGTGDASEKVHDPNAFIAGRIQEQQAKRETVAQKKADDERKAQDEAAKKAAKEAGKPEPAPSQPKDTRVTVETGRQITEVLDLIFSQVAGIAELGAGKKNPGNSVEFYKYFVGLTSDDNVILLHIDVVPFIVPNVKVDNGDAPKGKDDGDFYQPLPGGRRVPKNYMEFDYIFTGNNKDILNFDLKFQDLQFMLASNLNLGPGVHAENTQEGQKAALSAEGGNGLLTVRKYDAIIMPRNTEAELKNYTQYTQHMTADERKRVVEDTNIYMQNLSMYYAMAPINVVMTIRGNPNIMAKFTESGFLEHRVTQTATATGLSATNIGEKVKYRDAFVEKILKSNTQTAANGQQVRQLEQSAGSLRVVNTLGSAHYSTMPVFVTVNVMGPNVNFRTGQAIQDGKFATRLLFDNFYVVFKVTNVIEGNNFTQQLELYSHNIFGMGKLMPPTARTK